MGGVERGQHFVEPEKSFQYEEIHARFFEQANLLGHEVLGLAQRRRPLAFDELGAGDAAGDERPVARNFPGDANGGAINLLGLSAIAGAV